MNMKCFGISILAMVVCCFGHQDHSTAKISNFISETLQLTEIQNYWSNLEVSLKSRDGKQLLNNIEKKFVKKHNELVAAVERLAKESEDSYESHWSTLITNLFGQLLGGRQSCCHSDSTNFKSVNSREEHQRGCELFSKLAYFGSAKLNENFEKAFVANVRNDGAVKRQYFASVEGLTTVYPKLQKPHCEAFEPADRPWFGRSINQQPRQVVIVVDNKYILYHILGWMWDPDLPRNLINSVIRQINSLTPYDEVAILAITGHERKRSGCKNCFNSEFVFGTEQNKKEIRNFVQGIAAITTDASDYDETFKDAFSFFHQQSSDATPTYSQELVFFTQSVSPSLRRYKHIAKAFKHYMKDAGKYSNPIELVVSNQNALSLSFKLPVHEEANSQDTNQIKRPHNLIAKELFQPDTKQKQTTTISPVWSLPYLDKWGLGQVITVSRSVYQNGDLIGVAAVDSSLDSFFDVLSSIDRDDGAYAFLLNDAGHVISHPLLHRQNEVDLNAVNISSLERDEGFEPVIASIRRGENGEKQFYATRYQERGSGYETMNEKVLTTYYWKKVPNTKFIIGLAVVAQSQINEPQEQKISESSLLFHRFDLLPPEIPCSHYNNYATIKKSSLFLTSRAFLKEKDHQLTFQRNNDVTDLTSYVINNKENRMLLKDGVRDEIIATDYIQNMWTQNTYQSNVVWRHFTTPNGVFRIYPGIQIPEWYDPTNREWYHQSLSLKNRGSIITTPYKDPASHMIVVTIAQALYQNSGDVDRKLINPVIGVTGQDIRFDYFYKQFLLWYPTCTEKRHKCYMIDESGFTIITNAANHTNPQLLGLKRTPSVKLHVTQMEPEISRFLIMKQIFQVKTCSMMSTGCTRQTFQIKNLVDFYKKKFHVRKQRFQFSLEPIKHSNAYLLVRSLSKQEIENDNQEFKNQNYFDNGKEFFGEKSSIYGDSQSDRICQGSYRSSFINASPCIPATVTNDSPMFDTRSIIQLSQCYATQFTPFTMKSRSIFSGMENLVVFVLLVVYIQNLSLTNSLGSFCVKLVSKFSRRQFANSLLIDVENVIGMLKDNHPTSNYQNLNNSSSDCKQTPQDTDAPRSRNTNMSTLMTEAGRQSKLDQPDPRIEYSKYDNIQADSIDGNCTLQATKLCRVHTSQGSDDRDVSSNTLQSRFRIPSDRIQTNFETTQASENLSSSTFKPHNRAKSTSPAPTKHNSSDYYWQLLLREFPIVDYASDGKLQEVGHSKYGDLPVLHKTSEDMFQSMFDQLTAEEHRLMSFLTPEEEWDFLYFCEKCNERPFSCKNGEICEKLACGQY